MPPLPRRAIAAVLARDNLQCQACGARVTAWHSIQHRKARGTGGGNNYANLVLLCGSATSPGCHRRCEDREAEMHERGFWVNSWEDPAAIPLVLFDGTARILDDTGGWKVILLRKDMEHDR